MVIKLIRSKSLKGWLTKSALNHILGFMVILIFIYLGFSGISKGLTYTFYYDHDDFDLVKYRDIDEAFLDKEDLTLEVLNDELEVIYRKGAHFENPSGYSLAEYKEMIKNNGSRINIVHRIIEEDGQEKTVLVKQYFTSNSLSKANSYYALTVALFGISICASVVFVLQHFIKSVYKGIKRDTNIIQEGFKGEHIDDSQILLEEMSEIAEEYNGVVAVKQEYEQIKRLTDSRYKRMLSALAHDLKSPITSLIGYSEFLGEQEVEKDQEKKFLRYIHEASMELDDLVSLLFKQMEYQEVDFTLNKVRGDIVPYINNIFEQYKHLFQQNNYRTQFTLTHDPFEYEFDYVQLRRALSNILDNFISHNPENTLIIIHTHVQQESLIIQLMNDGTPIPIDKAQSIFQPFVQNNTASRSTHSGLGLYISKEIIHKHGGQIRFDSKGEHVNNFIITFL